MGVSISSSGVYETRSRNSGSLDIFRKFLLLRCCDVAPLKSVYSVCNNAKFIEWHIIYTDGSSFKLTYCKEIRMWADDKTIVQRSRTKVVNCQVTQSAKHKQTLCILIVLIYCVKVPEHQGPILINHL
jgi:hypothetical protein